MGFFKSFIRELLDQGHSVDIACNYSDGKVADCYEEWGCSIYKLSCTRSPISSGNITAINEIKKLIHKENYDIVHCHTPIAAACTRIACKSLRKSGLKVIYTAHGFHFYKGAPLKNWLMFYQIEKLCSKWTDVLITINKEDYELANKKFKAKSTEYVPGVGIDIAKFRDIEVDKVTKREELGIPCNSFLMLSVGELNENKNHESVIRALAQLNNSDIHYAIAGVGSLDKHLLELSKELGVDKQVHLLGYRTDVNEICKTSDLYVHPSYREGLPVSVMEAMASGLPILCSRVRGNVDLVNENGGFLFNPHNVDDCKHAIEELLSKELKKIGDYNAEIIKVFDSNSVNVIMRRIYNK